jgi:uncharacterized membrane protein YeaQ/YmgE (transglycosylase-associated protein family)
MLTAELLFAHAAIADNQAMGVALWAVAGVIAFFVARNVPSARPAGRMIELATALLVALLFGVIATILDFGGWQEPEWRAALFCFFGALAVMAAARLVRLAAARRA